jgi:hypothetical protein
MVVLKKPGQIDLHEIWVLNYRRPAFKFKSITWRLRFTPASFSWWRRPLITSHHSGLVFLYERPRRFPQTAPIVVDVFEPVTWHHQRRPSIRAPTCKTAKTRRGWPAEPPPTIKSVQYLCEEGRQKESERERVQERDKKTPLSSSPYSPFIPLHAKCPFYPCQAHCKMGTSVIFSDLIWLVSWILEASCDQGSCLGTNPFRGPKSHSGADLAPLQGGNKYFPNNINYFLLGSPQYVSSFTR